MKTKILLALACLFACVAHSSSAYLQEVADVNVGGSATAIQIVPLNLNRVSVGIMLNDDATVAIRVGSQATISASRGIRLKAGSFMSLNAKSPVYAIRESAGTATVSVLEETL